jgi:hypothetical protein
MIAPGKYLPIRRCIYCGTCVADKRAATARFGDEHIIPFAFGGRLELPEASCRPMVSDLRSRVDRLGGNVNIVRRGGFSAPIFGHMLAKIAHSYAVAELGMDGFNPILNNLIRGLPTLHMAQFVGGNFLPEPKSTDLHEISIKLSNRIDGRGFWVVRVRLFADLDMPAYYIVAGEPLS